MPAGVDIVGGTGYVMGACRYLYTMKGRPSVKLYMEGCEDML